MATDRQRRQAEQRRVRRQAERRRQQAARRHRLNIIASVIGTLLVIGVVVTLIVATHGSDSPKAGSSAAGSRSTAPTSTAPTSTPAPTTSAAPSSAAPSTTAPSTRARNAATATCRYPRSGTAAKAVTVPPTKAGARGTAVVRLTTSRGPLTFTLNRAAAPCTVNSFVSLAKQKYFDGTRCHRLVTKGIFVLQCGDPTATGNGGPGYSFADELTGTEKYSRGVLAMANAGPNTNGSQFFIVDKDSQLGPSYTVFGRVTAGLAVVDTVSAAGTSNGSTDGPPKLPLTLSSVQAP